MARILAARGMRSVSAAQAFLEPRLDALHDPFAFVHMEAAVERLLAAIRLGERVVVHGDYDVDGITGTVLLVTVLRHLGADVDFILPHRVEDGYGLGPDSVDKARAIGAVVLVAVDCGITSHDAGERAASSGLDLIIVDHHLPQGELPAAHAILNPRLPDAGYPEDDLAAVGLAFKLARALLLRADSGLRGISMLKLVALGTVADLVPLRGENRVMTYHGLASLADAVNPGLLELMRVSKVDPRAVSASDVGFRMAPRINAAGRLGHPRDAAELFLTRDKQRARQLAESLEELNVARRRMDREVFEQARQFAVSEDDGLVVAWGESWHRGVIGIVASRLVEHWGRPALVVSVEGDEAHGSARSVAGFDMVAALESVRELLTTYGGHHQAAGFRLPTRRLTELREALLAYAAATGPPDVAAPIVCDARLQAGQISTAFALELERLAPFGIGNPRPRFLCPDMRLAGPPRLLKHEHVKLMLRGDSGDIEAMAWRRSDLAAALTGVDVVSLVATIRPRRWAGRLSAQLEIQDIGT